MPTKSAWIRSFNNDRIPCTIIRKHALRSGGFEYLVKITEGPRTGENRFVHHSELLWDAPPRFGSERFA